MEFILPFQAPTFPFQISYGDKIIFIGSCFSEEMGNKMSALKFDVLKNPNGIIYDPLSLADALLFYIENKPFDEENLFELNGLWHSWKHHSVFSGINKKEVLEKINNSQSRAHVFLKSAKVLFITFGTAFNYKLNINLKNVANCHKAPSNYFTKNLLSTEEIKAGFINVITVLETFNPNLKIIFTVSPVKHIKDGIIENNRSKARLIEAVHAIIEEKGNAFYFPSYELVNDVLRDYRFYKKDMAHPNEAAIEYVFEEFYKSYFDNSTKQKIKQIENILSAVNHKPFLKESWEHQSFLTAQLEKIAVMEKENPLIDLSKEKNILEKAKHK